MKEKEHMINAIKCFAGVQKAAIYGRVVVAVY